MPGNRIIDLILNLSLKDFFAGSKKAQAEYSKMKGSIEKKPVQIRSDGAKQLLGNLARIGAAYIGLRKIATDFAESEQNLANIASLGVQNLAELEAGINRIAVETPVALHDLETGLYDVVSAGVAAADQIEVLEASAKAAKAGLAETTDALGLGSSVIKGYGKTWADFTNVMDLAFNTVKLGQTTFPELAASVGQVVPVAAAAKIPIEELFGAYATLTGVTGTASEVTTQLRGIIAATIKPSAELTALFQDYGSASEALADLGLPGYLERIRNATGGNTDAMAKLFPRVEALNGALALSGAQFDTFIEKTGEMETAAGAMGDAFDKNADTAKSAITLLDNRFQVFSRNILADFAPLLIDLIDDLGGLLIMFTSLDKETQRFIITMGGVTALFLKLPAIIRVVRTAILGLQASLGPAGWLALGIGAAATAFVAFKEAGDDAIETLEEFREKANSFQADKLKAELKTLEEEYQKYLNTLATQDIAETLFNTDNITPQMRQYARELDKNFGIVENRTKDYEARLKILRDRLEALETPPPPEEPQAPKPITGPGVTAEITEVTPPDRLKADIDTNTQQIEQYYQDLANIPIGYRDLTFNALEEEHAFRTRILQENLETARQIYGEESEAYRQLTFSKLANEQAYQRRKMQLQIQGFQQTLALTSQFMAVFQGQSRAMFEIGKGAAIAEAIVNTLTGATRALRAYPPPISFLMAAAQLALGYGYVNQIRSQQYQSRAAGGLVDEVYNIGIRPPGKDEGWIPIQTGEMVINRQATQKFLPLLEAINQRSFQAGGQVSRRDVRQPAAGAAIQINPETIRQAVIDGFNESRLKVVGEITVEGADINIALENYNDTTAKIGG